MGQNYEPSRKVRENLQNQPPKGAIQGFKTSHWFSVLERPITFLVNARIGFIFA